MRSAKKKRASKSAAKKKGVAKSAVPQALLTLSNARTIAAGPTSSATCAQRWYLCLVGRRSSAAMCRDGGALRRGLRVCLELVALQGARVPVTEVVPSLHPTSTPKPP